MEHRKGRIGSPPQACPGAPTPSPRALGGRGAVNHRARGAPGSCPAAPRLQCRLQQQGARSFAQAPGKAPGVAAPPPLGETSPGVPLSGLGMGLHVATAPFLEGDTREHTRHLRATRSPLGAQRTPAVACRLQALATGLPESSPVAAAAASGSALVRPQERVWAGPLEARLRLRPRSPHLEPDRERRGGAAAWPSAGAARRSRPDPSEARARVSRPSPLLRGGTPAGVEPAAARH